ncbi:hypothetical protein BJ742DRAFT_90567 [Cladochytrium replicatum]|nr:hypothetical protein BJ742DRAFT_90567 [Cladochytrium replicatum]
MDQDVSQGIAFTMAPILFRRRQKPAATPSSAIIMPSPAVLRMQASQGTFARTPRSGTVAEPSNIDVPVQEPAGPVQILNDFASSVSIMLAGQNAGPRDSQLSATLDDTLGDEMLRNFLNKPIPGVRADVALERIKDPVLMPPKYDISPSVASSGSRTEDYQSIHSDFLRTVTTYPVRPPLTPEPSAQSLRVTVQTEKPLSPIEGSPAGTPQSAPSVVSEMGKPRAPLATAVRVKAQEDDVTSDDLFNSIFATNVVLSAEASALALLIQEFERIFMWNTFGQTRR